MIGLRALTRRNGGALIIRRAAASPVRRDEGFSFIELLIVVTITAILATAALGLSRWETKRTGELELRRALREIRTAIDKYHEAAEAGLFETDPDQYNYPPDLETLVEGVELPQEDDERGDPRIMKFLRRIPGDPMSDDGEWGLRSYQDDADSRFWGRENVYDVFTNSRRVAIDGTLYRDW